MNFMTKTTLAAVVLTTNLLAAAPPAADSGHLPPPVWGGELRFALHADPKTWDPLQASEESSVAIRYLTHGSLLRMNRRTQKEEPELAESWKIAEQGRKVIFTLRSGLRFSDGTPAGAEDVAFTLKRTLDPALHSPLGDSIRAAGDDIKIDVPGPLEIAVTFPAAVPDPAGLFDSLPILSAHSPLKDKAGLGPFMLGEVKAGSYVLLKRNPNYWRTGPDGRRLPFLDSIRLDIQSNRDLELQRFRKGEYHLLETLDAESFTRLQAELGPRAALDLGPAFDNEMLWFNEAPGAPIEGYKKTWFQSRNFRRAIAESIHLDDIVRLVYQGRATPAAGILSRANQFWLKAGLTPHPCDPDSARKRLAQDQFHYQGSALLDRENHRVEFSLVTNSGSRTRGRIATILQDDLAKLGIQLNIVALDFPALLERIGRTGNYEAALLGFVNEDFDPSSGDNVWLSRAPQHMWNPNQKQPATPWEAEIDKLIAIQASTADRKKRKAAFDKVQQIIWDEAPVIHLVNRNALVAVSPRLRNLQPALLNPHVFWNADSLYLAPEEGHR
jgi:peptide/nickel transport system substrate-binding protein